MTDLTLTHEMRLEVNRIMSCEDKTKLLRELRDTMQISTKSIITMAALVKRLEQLCVPIDIEFAALPFIRKIAWGQLNPELFLRLQGDPMFLERASSLPLPDQTAIAENMPVKVMLADGDHVMQQPLTMTRKQINQVFARGKMRNDSEQMAWLRDRYESEAAAKATIEDIPIRLDKKRNGLVVNGVFIKRSELEYYLAALKGGRKRVAV